MTQPGGAVRARRRGDRLGADPRWPLEFVVPLVVTNGTTAVIEYESCGAVLERRVGGAWRDVWGAACTLQTRPRPKVQPGASLRSEIVVSASTQLSGSQTWPDAAIEGEYRMRVLLAQPGDGVFPAPLNTSNAFTLRVTL